MCIVLPILLQAGKSCSLKDSKCLIWNENHRKATLLPITSQSFCWYSKMSQQLRSVSELSGSGMLILFDW